MNGPPMSQCSIDRPKLGWAVAVLGTMLCAAPYPALAQGDAGVPSAEISSDAGGAAPGEDECVPATMEVLSGVSDAGPEKRRRRAREICEESGAPAGGSEGADEPFLESEDAMQVLAVLVELLVFLGFGAVVWWIFERRKRKLDEVLEEEEPAFEMDFGIEELRSDPEQLEEIRDDVEEICIMRIPSATGGGKGGAAMRAKYAGFAIDANGRTHEFSRSKEWDEVERDADWLAERLGVDVRNEAYG